MDRIEYGALYSAVIMDNEVSISDIIADDEDEIGDICLYSIGDDVGSVSEIDAKLLEFWDMEE